MGAALQAYQHYDKDGVLHHVPNISICHIVLQNHIYIIIYKYILFIYIYTHTHTVYSIQAYVVK